MQPFDNRTIERLFFLYGAAAAEKNLNDDIVARPLNAQIMWIDDQVVVAIFGDDLKPVALGNGDGFAQSSVHGVPDGALVRGQFPFANCNSSERHDAPPCG